MDKFEFIVKKPTFLNGVYCIIQLQNGMVYVGETKDVYIRFADHINCISTENTATFHGSNDNLINEKDKKFWFYPLLDNEKQCINFLEKQGNRNTPFSQNLYDETIIMYLFRKYGFGLYNARNDNCGRNFFAEENIDNLEKMTIDFIQDKDNSRTKDEIMESIKQYDEVVQKALREILGKANFEKKSNIKEEYSKIELEKIWNKKKTSSKYYLLNPDSDIEKAIKEIAYGYLDSKILEYCGIECINNEKLSNMIKKGKLFDTTIFSKVGNYKDQLLSTILALKADDIENYGKCLWSFKGLNENDTRLFLQTSSNPDNKKESKYIFLTFTPSKKHSGNMNSEETNQIEVESFAEFKERFRKYILKNDSYITAKSVSIGKRDNYTVQLSKELNESLKDMFPIIMNCKKEKGENKSRAFVISKIWALDNYVNALDGIYNCYWRHTAQLSDKGYEKSYINEEIGSQISNAKDKNGRDCFVTFINHDKLRTSTDSSRQQCGRIRGLGKNNDTMENFKKATKGLDEELIKKLEKNVTIEDYNAEEVRKCLANTILSKDLFDEYSPFKNVLIAKLEYPYIVTLSDKEK